MATHTLPPYPPVAVRNNQQGVSLLQVVIAQDGRVSDAKLVKSSGFPMLDDAALAHVTQQWRWETQADACTAPITTRVEIIWKLNSPGDIDVAEIARTANLVLVDEKEYPPGALARQQSGATLIAVLQTETGEPRTHMLRSSGSEELDRKTLELAKARYGIKPAELDGSPIGGFFMVAFIWNLPGTPKPDLQKIRAAAEFFATHRFGPGADVSRPPEPDPPK
jgi:TonB family protein